MNRYMSSMQKGSSNQQQGKKNTLGHEYYGRVIRSTIQLVKEVQDEQAKTRNAGNQPPPRGLRKQTRLEPDEMESTSRQLMIDLQRRRR